MPRHHKRRAHVVNSQGIPIKKHDPVADIIRPVRRNKKKSFFGKFVTLAAGVIVLYGLIVGVKTFMAIRQISVKNIGGSSPFLNLPKINPNTLAGEGDGRINILLIGVGGAGHPGGTLADTIMVASIDPKNKNLALLSIPRDLLVTYPKPAVGKDKINSVHSYGEKNIKTIPGGGPALLKKAVSETLDLPIHYFIRADFTGFKKIVDTLGGITVTVSKPINDPFYPADNMRDYKPFKITAGVHQLNGEVALQYARSRETTSDFDRARRQQQVLQAIKGKALSVGVLANPKKIFDILDIVGQHIRTDLQPNEFEQLLSLIKDIKSDKVISKVLDNGPTGPLMSSDQGGYYLVPKTGNFKEIQKIAHGIFTDPLISQENATIAIVNASSTAGVATDVADQLKAYNYTILTPIKSEMILPTTTIYDQSKGTKQITLGLLKKRLSAPVESVIPTSLKKVSPKSDILIVIGEDYHGGKKTK